MKFPIIVSSLLFLAAARHFRMDYEKQESSMRSLSLFDPQQSIYRSKYSITNLLTPADGQKPISKDTIDIPTIFFTLTDPKFKGGSSIFVLEKFAAYEILEGGRDTTSDYKTNPEIYFGANTGIYRFIPEALSARKFGTIDDDILQIQKAVSGDIIIRNSENKLYRVTRNGTAKKRVTSIYCVKQFVLDTKDNIYYVGCKNNSLHIIPVSGRKISIAHTFEDILLIRPPFILNSSIPFLADKRLYMLYENGSIVPTELLLRDKPTAVSVDAALYFSAALNGAIYELNVMELLLKSVFRIPDEGKANMSKVIISIMGPTMEYFRGFDII